MADSIATATSPSQKSESPLISPHHVLHAHVTKGDGVSNETSVCLKSCPEKNQVCKCLQADFSVSKHIDQSQNALKCTHFDADCIHSSIFNSQGKCHERVNGLTHALVEQSSGDNTFLVNLVSTCKVEGDEIDNCNYNVDSNHKSDDNCLLRQLDNDVSYDGVEIMQPKQVVPEGHNSIGRTDDVDILVTELDKTSLHHHSDSSECLLASSNRINGFTYKVYESEKQMPDVMKLITKDLSEPYSIYTYRYFIHKWPKLCFLAMADNKCVGAIVCKLDFHKKNEVRRGYIAMLAVDSEYRRRRIGSTLVKKAIKAMIRDGCDEVVLETEITNQAALHLYENLGFVRDKRLFRYYLNGVDALRLKLWLR